VKSVTALRGRQEHSVERIATTSPPCDHNPDWFRVVSYSSYETSPSSIRAAFGASGSIFLRANSLSVSRITERLA